MELDRSVGTAGGGGSIRGVNGNGKNTTHVNLKKK